MKSKIIWTVATLATFFALVGAYENAQAREMTAPRPTFSEARHAAAHFLVTYAEGLDGKLVFGACAFKGAHSTVCLTTIKGPVVQRHRIVVTPTPSGKTWIIRIRPYRGTTR